MARTYDLDTWEKGTLVSPAQADLATGIVTPAKYSGNTPITPERLEYMSDSIRYLFTEGAASKDIFIGPEEEAPEDAKIIIDDSMVDQKIINVTDEYSESTQDSYTCNYVNKQFNLRDNIMTLNINDNSPSLSSWELYNITSYSLYNSNGNLLTFNKGIKIGKGINKIKISGICNIYNETGNGDFNLFIVKNGSVTGVNSYVTSFQNEWIENSLANMLIDVAENDVLTLGVIAGQAGTYRIYSGYITVEVVC